MGEREDKRTSEEIAKEFMSKKNPTYKEMKQFSRALSENTVANIDKSLSSRWIRGQKRASLTFLRAVVIDSAETSHQIFTMYELISNLQNAVLLLSGKLERWSELTDKNLEGLKGEIKNLLDSDAVNEVGNAIQNMKKASEKKDKLRQDILRDSIV